MRLLAVGLVLLAGVVAEPALAQDSGGMSSAAISRCAGKAGAEIRESDPAFGFIALDGMPWVTIERTEDKVGMQSISTTVTGTGARRRRDHTAVPFRFTCLLNDKGEVVMFHASQLLTRLGDELPPSHFVNGSATYLERMATPRGLELRVQLLDVAKPSNVEILAEQVVRTGWQVPIPFFLRLPKDTPVEGRKLAIGARMVVGREVLFALKEPRPVSSADLGKSIDLTLAKAQK
jgi:uncharacterized lipoprotein YbaY